MTGLPPDVAVLVIAFGLVLALGCYLVTNLSPGGMITPGWLALALIVQPLLALVIGGVVVVTYFICQALQRVVILYGKRLFATVVLVAVFFQLTAFMLLVRTAALYDVTTLGFIVPGLVAYQLIRQPAVATITATATVTMVAYCVTLAGVLLRLIPVEERTAASGIATAPSEPFSSLHLALAATGFVAVLAVIAVQARRVRSTPEAGPTPQHGGEREVGFGRVFGLGWVAGLGRVLTAGPRLAWRAGWAFSRRAGSVMVSARRIVPRRAEEKQSSAVLTPPAQLRSLHAWVERPEARLEGHRAREERLRVRPPDRRERSRARVERDHVRPERRPERHRARHERQRARPERQRVRIEREPTRLEQPSRIASVAVPRGSREVAFILAGIAAAFTIHFGFGGPDQTESSTQPRSAIAAAGGVADPARVSAAVLERTVGSGSDARRRSSQRKRSRRKRAGTRTVAALPVAAGPSAAVVPTSTSAPAPAPADPSPAPSKLGPSPARNRGGEGGTFDDSG